jgi:hypothetical protein
VIFYNATGSEIINDPITGASDLDVQSYNLTAYIAQEPIKVKYFNEDGKIFYNQWVTSGGGWLDSIRESVEENIGDFEGFGLLMFLPIIFAAIFTRNTAGIGGGMIVAFIGVFVTLGLLVIPLPILALIAFVAVIGILAYRVING